MQGAIDEESSRDTGDGNGGAARLWYGPWRRHCWRWRRSGWRAAATATGARGDSVYLYFFNGYVGSTSMTVIGPTGTLVSGVPFGERTKPVLFDRTLGTNLTVLLDVIPEPVQISPSLFDLYPQETATVLLKRRTGAASGGHHRVPPRSAGQSTVGGAMAA